MPIFGIPIIGTDINPGWVYFWLTSTTIIATFVMYILLRKKKWLPPKLE